jgi:hypothetical protein
LLDIDKLIFSTDSFGHILDIEPFVAVLDLNVLYLPATHGELTAEERGNVINYQED